MRSSVNSKKRSRGFVYFEILIASVILSTACLYLSGSLRASLDSAGKMRNAYGVALAAENFLWELDHAHSDVRHLKPDAPALKNLSWEVQATEEIGGGLLQRQKIQLRWDWAGHGEEFWEVLNYSAIH